LDEGEGRAGAAAVDGEEVLGGAGRVVERADHDRVTGASQAGALAGNLAAAAAIRARLKGERLPAWIDCCFMVPEHCVY
jgi:hypothetical protein